MMLKFYPLNLIFAVFLGYIGGIILDSGDYHGWLFAFLAFFYTWFSIVRINPPSGV